MVDGLQIEVMPIGLKNMGLPLRLRALMNQMLVMLDEGTYGPAGHRIGSAYIGCQRLPNRFRGPEEHTV